MTSGAFMAGTTKKERMRSEVVRRIMTLSILIFLLFAPRHAVAELLDRVVAYVDSRAITYSEFQEVLLSSRAQGKEISEGEVLDSMVNRYLLLKDARRLRLEASTEDELLENYIELRIRSMIIVNERDIRSFYEENVNQFKGQEFNQIRDDIETYLFEKETTASLKRQIDQLREQSLIVIQLEDGT